MADEKNPPAISAISIKGFKSFLEEQRIEIRPLTLLAGANSSGKSSALQPLLLLKQTLEAPYDPGPLLLEGPHVHFTLAEQVLARFDDSADQNTFEVCLEHDNDSSLRSTFTRVNGEGFDLVRSVATIEGRELILEPGLSSDYLKKALDTFLSWRSPVSPTKLKVSRDRCFFRVMVSLGKFAYSLSVRGHDFERLLLLALHVPGLRGNPWRVYKTAAVEKLFPGAFENYVASLILYWQQVGDPRYEELNGCLERLDLTGRIQPKPIDATQIEIMVGRRLPGNKRPASSLVNIADVGFGVSQILPVLVALLAARPGQLVYLEQPELHLHPRAQQALAAVLTEAANRGVRVVVETHSSILLLAIQTLVAEGKISPDKVMLHWFQLDSRGATQVTSGEMDQLGAYGDWPEDFGEVQAAVDNRYLDAVEAKAFSRKKLAKK